MILKFDTLGTCDVSSLRDWRTGLTYMRKTRLPLWMVEEIIRDGGQARCDGVVDRGLIQCELDVYCKYELAKVNGKLYLIDHTFQTQEEFNSVKSAKESLAYT